MFLQALPFIQLHVESLSNELKQEHKNYEFSKAQILMLGRYSFALSESIAKGEIRPLRNPNQNA